MKRVEYKDIDFLLCYMMQEKKRGRVNLDLCCEIEDFLSITIPKGFVQASDEYIQAKYFSKNRPKIIYKDEYGESNLLFQKIQKDFDDENNALESAKRAIRDNDSAIRVYEEGKIIKENYKVVWMDYKNYAADECIYNLLFIIKVGERGVFGAFNCMFENYDIWKPVILQMLNDMKVKEKKSEGRVD